MPRPHKPGPAEGAPEIVLSHTNVGRETFAAITEDLAGRGAPLDPGPQRGPLETIDYGDRTAFQSLEQPTGPIAITVETTPVGRETQAAIEDALAVELLAATRAGPAHPRTAADPPAEIYEVSTFVVQGREIFTKVTEHARRRYVEERLLHRLPALSMDEVVRIDVSRGATSESVILRVWSRVPERPR